MVLALVELVTLVAGCLSRPVTALVPLHLGWAFSPVSDTVTIRVTSPAGTTGRRLLAQSQLAVSEHAGGRTRRGSGGGGAERGPGPPGGAPTPPANRLRPPAPPRPR